MTKPKIIYIVTSGEYSDYRIDGVFSSKENAELYIRLEEPRGDIEEWELDAYVLAMKRGLSGFLIVMQRDGTTLRAERESLRYTPSHPTAIFYGENCGWHEARGAMRIDVLAKSKEHAIKIANDTRRQIVAENRWGINPELVEGENVD